MNQPISNQPVHYLWKASYRLEVNNGSYIQRLESSDYFITLEPSLNDLSFEIKRPWKDQNGMPEIISAEYLGTVHVPISGAIEYISP